VANGGNNAVAVVRLSRNGSQIEGFIPAGWYPGALAIDGKSLFIANVKGIGSRPPKAEGKWNSHGKRGTIACVEIPDAKTLAEMTQRVKEDALLPQVLRAQEKALADQKRVPVPAHFGEPSVFEHVVYIIKENRTYDQVFGDMPKGNNDPKLCTFGREVS